MSKVLLFDYSNSLCSNDELVPILEKLKPEIERIDQARSTGYSSLYSSINVITDTAYHVSVQTMIDEKKQLLATMMIVIGIGGSNLGTVAIQEALCGLFYNEMNPALKIYYADTIDAEYIATLLHLAQKELQAGNSILLNVVTKSGTTTETIINFELFLSLLQNYYPETYQQYIIVTTDKDSVLWHLAHENKFSVLEIPKKVGGRFSVLSAVGLFPLGMLHLPIYDLLAGAAYLLPQLTAFNDDNIAAYSAAVIFAHYSKGITIQDIFVFSHQLKSIGAWYRQLMGESIGKEHDRSGIIVERGINPTVSIGTIDLHSVGQLYLGGPRDKCSTFVTIQKTKKDLYIPDYPEFEESVANIQGKSVTSIMHAIVQGVKAAYKNNKRPYLSLVIPELSAWYIGQFLQYKMIEMMYLGYLLEVNPFDQPNVELYKTETRKLLRHE